MPTENGELRKLSGKRFLICCFGGMGMKMGGILPYEFLNYLSTHYEHLCDLLFYIDEYQCCYHQGIKGITTDVDSTVKHIDQIISQGKYKRIIFMGVSAGGYASILFGSLCNNVTDVISFIPKTMLSRPRDPRYKTIKPFINEKTNYVLVGDTSIRNENDNHHIKQCEELSIFPNVQIIRKDGVNVRDMRSSGEIKDLLNKVVYSSNK